MDTDVDAGSGIPGWFVAWIVFIVVVGMGVTVWRVTVARRIARDAGLDPKQASRVALLGDDGVSATYLASTLAARSADAPATGKTVEQRLHELESLRSRGLVSDAEFAAQRQRILDSV